MEKKDGRAWEGKHFAFFCNRECESFPCHKGVPEEDFNCLFCYCPLYALGEHCGGNFTYTAKGVKNCTPCNIPHRRENYGHIIKQFKRLAELARRDADKDTADTKTE